MFNVPPDELMLLIQNSTMPITCYLAHALWQMKKSCHVVMCISFKRCLYNTHTHDARGVNTSAVPTRWCHQQQTAVQC